MVGVLLLAGLALIGCGDSHTSAIHMADNSPNAVESPKVPKEQSRQIAIEIWQELGGSVPLAGKFLYFRLYENGEVEFDYEVKTRNRLGDHPLYVFSSVSISPFPLSEDEYESLTSLSKKAVNDTRIKKEYDTVGLTLDITARLTVDFSIEGLPERRIIINNSDLYVIDESLRNRFPSQLVDLIEEMHSIRLERIPKIKPD